MPVRGRAGQEDLGSGDSVDQRFRSYERRRGGEPSRDHHALHGLDGNQAIHVDIPAMHLQNDLGAVGQPQTNDDPNTWPIEQGLFHATQPILNEADNDLLDRSRVGRFEHRGFYQRLPIGRGLSNVGRQSGHI